MFRVGFEGLHLEALALQEPSPFTRPILPHVRFVVIAVQLVHAGVHEVILATNPTVEGDATALHVMSLLADTDVTLTRLARGIAPGSQIEFANRAMLEEAFRGRREA